MKKNGYLKFDINVRDHFGSNNVALVFGRLLYWFGKKPDGFYKFKQRCMKHPLYKDGDSWGEELGMSRKILDPILSRLVNHHKTKSVYNKSVDKFDGKIFCSYNNHKTSQTYYFINREALGKFLASISIEPSTVSRPKSVPPFPPLEVDTSRNEPVITGEFLSSDVPNEQPLAHTHPDHHCIQTTTSLSGDASKNLGAQKEEEKLISKNMVDTWNSHMKDTVVWYPSYAERLFRVLKEFFKGCVENFKQYCLTVASADFLAGKSKNSKFKAFLFWAVKPAVIQDILSGAYGVKNFFSILSPEERKIKEQVKQLDSRIKDVDYRISKHSEEIIEGRNKLVSDLKESLSPQEIEVLRQESDHDFYEKHPAQSGIDDQYSQTLLNIHFSGRDGFLYHKLKERLGIRDIILPPQELLDEKAYLLRERTIGDQKLNEFYRKKKGLKESLLSSASLYNIYK